MGAAVPVISAIVTAGGVIWSANKSAKTSQQIASKQLEASNKVAEIDEESTKRQLEFLKEQDRLDRLAKETDRKMSYDQWVARQNNLAPYMGLGKASAGTLGHLMGYRPADTKMPDPRETVPYVPYPTPTAPEPEKAPDVFVPTDPNNNKGTLRTLVPRSPVTAPVPGGTSTTPDDGQDEKEPQESGSSATLVWMEGPDGSRKQVPAFSVPYFQKMGARVIANGSLAGVA